MATNYWMIHNSNPIGFSAALGFWKLFLVVAKSGYTRHGRTGRVAGTRKLWLALLLICDLVAVVATLIGRH